MTQETKFSDLKVFVVKIGMKEDILQLGSNKKYVTNAKDRNKKNIQLMTNWIEASNKGREI